MGVLILKNPVITINGIDFSDRCAQAAVTMQKADVDVTTFGSGGTKHAAGLSNDSFAFTLLQDFASSEIDQTLFPLYSNETEFTVKVKPTNAGCSASNPEYVGTVVLLSYPPISGSPGSRADVQLTLPVQGAISRHTTTYTS